MRMHLSWSSLCALKARWRSRSPGLRRSPPPKVSCSFSPSTRGSVIRRTMSRCRRCSTILYGGHGLCMPWYGTVEGDAGWMAIIETPDDAAVSIPRRDGLLGLVPEWEPQKQRFGPERVIRYVVFGRRRLRCNGQALSRVCEADGAFEDAGREAQDRPRGGPPGGRGEHLVLGPGCRRLVPRTAGLRHPAHPLEQRSATGPDQGPERTWAS